MKKLLFTLALTTAMAAGATVPTPRDRMPVNFQAPVALENVQQLPLDNNTRGYNDFTYTDLKFKVMECWYIGDLLKNNTGFYYILLSDAAFDSKGTAQEPGHLFRLLINAEAPADPYDFTVPCGVFFASADEYGEGTFDVANSDFSDVFYHPTDPVGNPGLFGYTFGVTDGVLEIGQNVDGTYSAGVDVTVTYYDDKNVAVANFPATGSYIGDVECINSEPEDELNYNPIRGDYAMNIPNMSGKYDAGYWELCLYSDGLVDSEGFVSNSGELFVMNLKVWKLSGNARYDKLAGVYTMTPFSGPSFPAGHFIEGRYYDIYGGNYFVVGTGLTVYGLRNDNLYHDYVGLANGGTITVTDLGDDIFRIDIDVTTPQDARMTATWEGRLCDFVVDMGDDASEASHENDVAVESLKAGANYSLDGRVFTSTSATSVYTIAGSLVAEGQALNVRLQPGAYIVTSNGTARKLIVK